MTQEELLKAIRTEIERLYNLIPADYSIRADFAKNAFVALLSYLDTLQEQDRPEPYNPVYDEAYLNEKITKASTTWKGVDVDKYMNEVSGREQEVDLEKELDAWRHEHFRGRRDNKFSGEYLERKSQLELVRHFFNLGLNTRKEE